MKRPSDLSKAELVEIVEALQEHLYFDENGSEGADGITPHTTYWNPYKSWDPEILERLAEFLQDHDLVPGKVMPATLHEPPDGD